ncbi:hypothetical protein BDN67DRAFT_973870 [Paxillus ammoniavirescens]|nr:hypothetical protein BDN67DRAFT_973870 [Paxillus ammoniavirescens]
MPLRFVRSKTSGVTPVDPLQAAITTTAFARDLVSTLQFPPATAAISVLLLIFETIQSIQTNRAGCDRLARRAAQILVDIDNQMRGRWDSAPELLIRNLQKFEGTLTLVYEFMRKLADSKWSDRFLRKNSIEDSLCEYTRLMEEAAQSFQLTTLIDLHYTVSTLARKIDTSTSDQTSSEACVEVPPPYKQKRSQDQYIQEPGDSQSCVTFDPAVTVSDLTILPMDTHASSQAEEPMTEIATCGVQDSLDDHYLPEELSSLTLGDDHGFRRYHQSEVMLRGRSRLKDGWWGGAMEVQVQDQPALIKKYDDPKDHAYRQWLRDVKMLQNLYHPNLPQMLGFSDEKAQTPFILLSNVKTQTPEALVRETLRTASLATCMELMLRFYRDLADTAMYVQRQLNLTESQVQDFFEASRYRVDSQKTLVVGLPPPREGQWCTGRNYGLAHTLLDACLHMLPNQGRVTYSYDKGDGEVTEDMQKKINHLVTLARALLPSGSESPELPPKLQELIEDNDFDTPCLTLRQVRDLTFQAGGHDHSWYERHVPADKFSVGDIGYISPGTGWDSFVRLRNVFEGDMGVFKTSMKSKGEHWCWENVPIRRRPLQAFEMPMNIAGWPVAVPPHKQIDVVVVHEAFVSAVKDAWQYLLQNGKKLAREAGVEPEDLILVTHAGTHQDFYIKDIRPQPFGMNHNRQLVDPRFSANPFHRQQMHGFHQPPHFNQPTMPSIVYLFTSLSPSHEPYWSSSPMCALPGADRPPLDRHFTYKIGYKTGFLNYVQLHAEDFESW